MNSFAQVLFTCMRSALRTLLRSVILIDLGKEHISLETHPLQNIDKLPKSSIGVMEAQHPSLPRTKVDVFDKHHPRTAAQVMR